jgi:hypothetical protein
MEQQVAHLYKITNLVTGEYYVGKHNGWTQDTKSKGLYWGSGNRIKSQVKKYGKSNFTYGILCYGTQDYIYDLEKKYVTKELIEEDVLCLNLTIGGDGPTYHKEETLKKISENRKGIPAWNKGMKTAIPPTKLSKTEVAQRLSERSKGNQYALGNKWTEEEKQKLRAARAKQIIPKEAYEKSSKTMSTLIWMNDGIRSYRIRPDNFQASKEKGMVEGRLSNYINNEYKEKLKMTTSNQWQKVKSTGHTGLLIKVQS